MSMNTTPRTPQLDFPATTGALIRRAAEKFGDKAFVVTPQASVSYAQVEAASLAFARHLLGAGVGKGTRVGAQLPFGADWFVAWLGATRIGALFIPLSTAYKPPELAKVLRQSDVDTWLVSHGQDRIAYLEATIEKLASMRAPLRTAQLPFLRRICLCGSAKPTGDVPPWAQSLDLMDPRMGQDSGISLQLLEAAQAEVTPADLMVVIYTSGTVSEPKGVVHTHGAMVRHGAQLVRFLDLTGDDKVYCGMPLFWVGGISCSTMPTMHVGATLLGMDRFDAGVALDLMEREQATVMTGWPAVTGPVMTHPSIKSRRIPAMSHPWYAPAGPRKHHSLGMSETCGPHTGCFADTRGRPVPEGFRNSMGVELPFIEHRIVHPDTGAQLPDGERGAILVRGYSLMNGLIKKEREEVFESDGFYNTGDEGFFHEGILYLTGRLTDMIKTSGNNVAPAEVEQALLALPGLLQAHVLGIPDAQRGEIVVAVLVPRSGAQGSTQWSAQALDADLRKSISNYKVPRKFLMLQADEIPFLSSGKLDRRLLRQQVMEGAGRVI